MVKGEIIERGKEKRAFKISMILLLVIAVTIGSIFYIGESNSEVGCERVEMQSLAMQEGEERSSGSAAIGDEGALEEFSGLEEVDEYSEDDITLDREEIGGSEELSEGNSTPPALEVKAYNGDNEYVSGSLAKNYVRFEASATSGEVEYRVDGGEWERYEEEIKVRQSGKIEFRAVSGGISGDIIEYEVEIEVKRKISVTAEWFEVTSTKIYDGTDEVTYIGWDIESEAFQSYFLLNDIEYEAHYAQAAAGENIEIIVDVRAKEDAEFEIVNEVVGIKGSISKREIQVNLQECFATYGLSDLTYAYTVDNALDEIELEFASNADKNSLPGEYRYWVSEREYANYIVGNFDEVGSIEGGAKLNISKQVVSEVNVDVKIDGGNEIEVWFEDANGVIVKYLLGIELELVRGEEVIQKQEIDEIGLYRLTVRLPEEIARAYELSKDIEKIEVEIYELLSKEDPAASDANIDAEINALIASAIDEENDGDADDGEVQANAKTKSGEEIQPNSKPTWQIALAIAVILAVISASIIVNIIAKKRKGRKVVTTSSAGIKKE